MPAPIFEESQMLRFIRVCSLAFAAAMVNACAPAAPPDTTAADTEAISKLRAAWTAAITAEDAAATAALYTADAVRMEDNMPAIKGREAIEKSFAELVAGFDCDVSLTSEELVINGNWAYDRGQFMSHMMPKDPKADMIMDQGKYLVILQKQADGSWLVAREIGNSNVPLPPPPSTAK
jgi:uncharacterized protein (TIGR02246 family)